MPRTKLRHRFAFKNRSLVNDLAQIVSFSPQVSCSKVQKFAEKCRKVFPKGPLNDLAANQSHARATESFCTSLRAQAGSIAARLPWWSTKTGAKPRPRHGKRPKSYSTLRPCRGADDDHPKACQSRFSDRVENHCWTCHFCPQSES